MNTRILMLNLLLGMSIAAYSCDYHGNSGFSVHPLLANHNYGFQPRTFAVTHPSEVAIKVNTPSETEMSHCIPLCYSDANIKVTGSDSIIIQQSDVSLPVLPGKSK